MPAITKQVQKALDTMSQDIRNAVFEAHQAGATKDDLSREAEGAVADAIDDVECERKPLTATESEEKLTGRKKTTLFGVDLYEGDLVRLTYIPSGRRTVWECVGVFLSLVWEDTEVAISFRPKAGTTNFRIEDLNSIQVVKSYKERTEIREDSGVVLPRRQRQPRPERQSTAGW